MGEMSEGDVSGIEEPSLLGERSKGCVSGIEEHSLLGERSREGEKCLE